MLTFTVGLIFAFILLLGMLRGIVLSMNCILMFSFLAIVNVFVGAMSLCRWLNYNFGKEILILNNKDKYFEYKQLLFGMVKTKKFNYCDFLKIILDRDFGRNPDYYFSLECGHNKFKLGIVNDSIEGIDIVKNVSNFIIK